MPLVNVAVNRPSGAYQMRFDLDPRRASEAVICNYLARGHFYEPDIATIFIRAIQPGDTVLDVGANIGIFSVLASRLVGPNGHVIAFEPAPGNLPRLAANLALNDVANVTVVEQPASDRAETVTFHLNSDNEGAHSLWDPGIHPAHPKSRENAQSFLTTTTTIDAQSERLGFPPPRLIKIDTEGAEQRVLAGAIELLREFEVPYVIAELNEFALEQMGSSQAELRRFMADLGYETFVLFEDGSLPRLIPPGTRVQSVYIINLLFSTRDDVAALWPRETHDPRASVPAADKP